MENYDVYGMGNALVDMEFKVEPSFLEKMNIDKGLMTLVEHERTEEILDSFSGDGIRACGGSAANTVIALSQFGGHGFYSCKVASDEAGQFYLNDLKDNNVQTFDRALDEGITGKCLVMVTPDADRTMNTFLGITSEYSEKEIFMDDLKKSKYLYIEGYLVASPTARHAAAKAKRIADKNNIKTSLTFSDPNMVEFFRSGMDEIIGSGIDLLFCNKDEALKYAQCDNLEEAIEKMKKIAKMIAVTTGSEGALVWDGEKLLKAKSRSVKAIDTNGAGDMFAGAFLYAHTKGHSPLKAAEFGCFAASHIVEKFGPRLSTEEANKVLESFSF